MCLMSEVYTENWSVAQNVTEMLPLGFKLRVSNVGSPACDNNV